MAEPVFNADDKVPPGGTPPATPPPNPTRVVTAKAPTNQEFWNNPTEATKKIVQEIADRGAQEFKGLSAAAQAGLINAARLTMKDKFPDFPKFSKEVEELVMKTGGLQATQPAFWETCYMFIKGQKYDTDVAAAEARGRMPAEAVSAAPREPEKKPEISYQVTTAGKSEAQVAEGLSLTADTYMKGKENLEKDIWPFTVDNRRKR